MHLYQHDHDHHHPLPPMADAEPQGPSLPHSPHLEKEQEDILHQEQEKVKNPKAMLRK